VPCIGKIHNTRTGGVGQVLYNNVTETAPLPAKKIFGTNLFLNNRLLVSTPTPPYASLREARLNFLGIEFSQLMVRLFAEMRTHFTRNP